MAKLQSKPPPRRNGREEVPEHPPLPFREKMIYVVSVAAGVAGALALLWFLRWVFTLTFAAVLLALFLRSGAELLARLLAPVVELGRGVSLMLFGLLVIGLFTLFLFIAAPQLSAQAAQLRSQLPESVESLKQHLRQSPWGQWLVTESEAIVENVAHGPQSATTQATTSGVATTRPHSRTGLTLQSLLSYLLSWAGGAISTIVSVLFVLFAGLYIAAEPDLYRRGILWLVPPRGREKADCVLARVATTLRYWLAGQLCAMAAVGTMTFIGLWILGAPLPFVFATLAGLLEFVPNVGPVIAGGLPILLSVGHEGRFLDGPSLAMAVLGWFVLVQMVESYLITPLIQRRIVELPPALLIVTQLSAAVLLGPVGVAIAAPLVASAMAVSREMFVVGDPEREDPEDRAT